MKPISRRDFVKGAVTTPLALGALGPFMMTHAGRGDDDFDVVIAGAGHNSLTVAAYLGTAGYRCLVLEGRPMVGGGTLTTSLTLPGLKEDVCSTVHAMIQGNPMFRDHEIDLRPYGLEYLRADPVLFMPFPDGTSISLWLDPERTAQEFAKFSKKDAKMYLRRLRETAALEPIFSSLNFNPPGFVKPLSQQLAELPHGNVWKRRLARSAWDNIRDDFENDHIRSFMLAGAFVRLISPEMPITGGTAYSDYGEQRHGRPVPKGGSGELAQTLARYVEDHGGTILVNKGVERLIVENGRCVGVQCVDGMSYRAKKAVVSSMHVKDLVQMAPSNLWGEDFLEGVDMWVGEPSAFLSHYALSEPPQYHLADGSTVVPPETLLLPAPDDFFRMTYKFSVGEPDFESPHTAMTCMTLLDPTRAPAGVHTLFFLSFAPFNLKQGPQHWDVIKEEAADRYLNFVRRFATNLTDDKILARFCETPLDIWRRNPGFWHGSIHGGQMSPSQDGAMRPVPGWGDYRMPIPGLYQTGATTHPGGSVSGGPGRNAVMVMLKDFGTSIPEVLSKRKK